MAATVDALNQAVQEHYGHLGPRFVRELLRARDRWPLWRRQFQRLREEYQRRAGRSPTTIRRAGAVAALRMVAMIAHRRQEMPWGYRNIFEELWSELVTSADDLPTSALRCVLEWADAHEEEFFGRRDSRLDAPATGWAGRWDASDDWMYLGVLRDRLAKILAEGGFDPKQILHAWRERGWLCIDSSGKARWNAKTGGRKMSFVGITRRAIEQLDELRDHRDEEQPGDGAARPCDTGF